MGHPPCEVLSGDPKALRVTFSLQRFKKRDFALRTDQKWEAVFTVRNRMSKTQFCHSEYDLC